MTQGMAEPQWLLTLDVDWAPDFVIERIADLLKSKAVRSTWFITHPSTALQRLGEDPELVELGIHPNFLPGSTHGDTPAAVLQYCSDLVPSGTAMRTHGLVQSTELLDHILRQTGVRMDFSIYLPRAGWVEPVQYSFRGRRCLRVPHIWEDDFEMQRPDPWWAIEPIAALGAGLRVFDFHPIHVYLNTESYQHYLEFKQAVPRLQDASPEELEPFIHKGAGTGRFFEDLVAYVSATGGGLRAADLWADREHEKGCI